MRQGKNARSTGWLALLVAVASAAAVPAHADGTAHALLQRDASSTPGKEILVLTVEYQPGGQSLPHRHNAEVVVYVLEGTVRMQVEGGPMVTLGPGETFYEGPGDVHTVSANASPTAPARILVFMLKDKAAPVTTAVAHGGAP